ncbi:hypothetical protein LOK49_LG11G02303 [Camellia lanceoleosa]|uniref:Uncharacterized protein n=1 Tax=Camellia lanceoleosa TaxID=1840588 RepID=A0ACC0G2A9_9ERIC|nr:hypothetical protein LOK49_LG11G02303 [Camellia lanceoleosa]
MHLSQVIYWKHTFCHPILATHLGKIGDVKWVHVDQALSLSLLSSLLGWALKQDSHNGNGNICPRSCQQRNC